MSVSILVAHCAPARAVLGAGSAHGAHLTDMASPEDVRWGWAGFGGPAPRLVDGLAGRVTHVALGGWHVLVVVD